MTARAIIIAALRATGERLSMAAITVGKPDIGNVLRVYHNGAGGLRTLVAEFSGMDGASYAHQRVAECIDEINAQRAAEDAAQLTLIADDRGPRR